MFKSIREVWLEHKNNFNIIWEMAKLEVKKQTIRTTLGFGWIMIRDLVFFAAFTAFRFAMSGSADMDGVNFIAYIFAGLVPWFFIADALNAGSSAIKSKGPIIKSLKFPITVLPTITTLGIILKRLFTLVILYIVTGLLESFTITNPLLVLYYLIAMSVLLEGIVLCFSGFIAVSKDFTQLYLALTRIIFYLVPVIWNFSMIEKWPAIVAVVKLNPMVYVIMGFRDAFLLGNMPNLFDTIYFWAICMVMIFFGSYVQHKLRRYYADFI